MNESVAPVLDALPFDVIHVDRAARIRYVNPAAMRTLERVQPLLAVPVDQLVGQPIDVLERLSEVVELTLNPMMDERGTFVGTVLTTRCHAEHDAEDLRRNAERVVTAATTLRDRAASVVVRTTAAARAGQSGIEISEESREVVAQLRESSAQIGQLVSLVSSVARQTKLLAITVAIEAAHAGDAGTAFGTIANEVKTLAREASKASSEIRERALAIRGDSQAVSGTLLRIDGILRELNAHQEEISTAVEAQRVAAASIASDVLEVARATGVATPSWNPSAATHTEEGVVDIRHAYFGRARRAEA